MTECNVENGVGWNEASRFGRVIWIVGRNSQKGAECWPERNGIKETLLCGLPRLGLTMNGMERKVSERSATLECNEVK